MTDLLSAQQQTLLVEEYKEASQLHRLNINLLFAHTAVFLTGTGAIVVKYLDLQSSGNWQRFICAAVGVVFSFLLLVHHERIFEYSISARGRAQEIERLLGLSLYLKEVKGLHWWGRISAYRMTQVVYIFAILAWVGSAACEIAR